VSVGVILATGLVAAVLTHRYRVTGTTVALQRIARVVFVLLLLYSGLVLVIGVTFLFYAD
jgi:hypothetical protein